MKKELLNPEWYRIYFLEREYDILNRAFKWEPYRAIWELYGISRQRVEQIIIRETKRLIKVTNLQNVSKESNWFPQEEYEA